MNGDRAPLRDRVLSLLSVTPSESRPLVLVWALSFCSGATIAPLFASSNALFLAAFTSDWLPYAYICSAAIGLCAAWLYQRAQRRLSMLRLVRRLLLAMIIVLVALRLGLALSSPLWPAFLLLAFHPVANALLNFAVWGLAGQLFTVRQGKRLFGLIGSGELGAMVLGGLATPLLVNWFGTEHLLLVSVAGLFGCLVSLSALQREFGADLGSSDDSDAQAGGLRALCRHKYTRSLFLLFAVGVAATRLIDFAFLDHARNLAVDEGDLAGMFGLFFAAAQAVTMLLLTFVTGPLLTRHGIGKGMLPRRLVLTGFASVSLLILFITPGSPLLTWLALAAKLGDEVLLSAITAPAFLVLYQPLRADRRLATQMTVESVIGPLASAATALVLLAVYALPFPQPDGALQAVAVFTMLVMVAWRWISRRANQGYRDALPEALQQRRLEGASLPLDEGDMLAVLRERLSSPRSADVLYALDLLAERSSEAPQQLLAPLLNHEHPDVRRDVLRRISAARLSELTDDVRQRLDVEEDPNALAAVLGTLADLEESEAVDVLGVFLDYPGTQVADAATVGLLRSGGIDGIMVAGERLLQLERSTHDADRERAARILGLVGTQGFYRHLLNLLWDPAPDVRRAALAAAAQIGNPRLWPAVIDNLEHVEYHAAAQRALVEAGDATLPTLEEALANPEASINFRVRIVEACGRIGGEHAISLLQLRMDNDDRRLRSAILQALDRLGFRCSPADRGNIDDMLWQELGDASWIFAAIVDIGDSESDACRVVRRALQHRVRQIKQRCLLLLGFIGDTAAIRRAGEQLESTHEEQRAYALELLETALSGDVGRLLVGLFTNPTPIEGRALLAPHFPQRLLGRTQRLSLLITPGGHRFEPWIRASAVRAAALLHETELSAEVTNRFDDESRLVVDTAVWALRSLDAERWAQEEERIVEQGLVGPDLLYWIESWKPGERPMFLTVEKVMVLRSVGVFADVPEEVLADLASYLDESEVAEGERVYEKGVLGRTMYIVADGQVRVHDEERTFIELGPGEIFGELTTLDPEPHSATVTALQDTRLLGLDRDTLYELMSAHPTVLRGLIHVLCRRLRGRR